VPPLAHMGATELLLFYLLGHTPLDVRRAISALHGALDALQEGASGFISVLDFAVTAQVMLLIADHATSLGYAGGTQAIGLMPCTYMAMYVRLRLGR
jgi:hypothetical protein